MQEDLAEGERRASDATLPRLGHELRGPVQVIAGFVELLLSEQAGPLTPEQRHYLEEAQRSCRRLARFAAELAAGGTAATEPVRPRAASFARVAEGLAASMKPRLDRRRQTLRVRIAPDARRGWFDPMRVEQVLENVIGNASEYGPEGGVIDLEAERIAGPCGAQLRVSVTDDGPGLSAPGAGRPGRGLGLGICQAILRAHGGSLLAENAPGRGARVRFTLAADAEEGA